MQGTEYPDRNRREITQERDPVERPKTPPKARKVCRACDRGPVNRPRGLCWSCYYDPPTRARFPVDEKWSGVRHRANPDPNRALYAGGGRAAVHLLLLAGLARSVDQSGAGTELSVEKWEAMLAPLTDLQAAVLLLRHLYGLTNIRIGEVIGAEAGAVHMTLKVALKKFRRFNQDPKGR